MGATAADSSSRINVPSAESQQNQQQNAPTIHHGFLPLPSVTLFKGGSDPVVNAFCMSACFASDVQVEFAWRVG
ncbi:MAG: hypothetical protein IPH82_19780 [Chloroflexi bacterium]|nr:hypothetical protein [Chloroflexota bacterium]